MFIRIDARQSLPRIEYDAVKTPWDPTLTPWEQFERYYSTVPRVLNAKCRGIWHRMPMSLRESTLACAEDGLFAAIRTYDPKKNSSFAAYAYMAISADLWSHTNRARFKEELIRTPESQLMGDGFVAATEAGLSTLLDSIRSLTYDEKTILLCQYELEMPEDAIVEQVFPGKSRAWAGMVSRRARQKVAKSLAN